MQGMATTVRQYSGRRMRAAVVMFAGRSITDSKGMNQRTGYYCGVEIVTKDVNEQ